jgi:hypothetical protein
VRSEARSAGSCNEGTSPFANSAEPPPRIAIFPGGIDEAQAAIDLDFDGETGGASPGCSSVLVPGQY